MNSNSDKISYIDEIVNFNNNSNDNNSDFSLKMNSFKLNAYAVFFYFKRVNRCRSFSDVHC